MNSLYNERQSTVEQKICLLCNKKFHIKDYTKHAATCTGSTDEPVTVNDDSIIQNRRSYVTINENLKKYCALCDGMIDQSEFLDHMLYCSSSSTDNKSKIAPNKLSLSMDNQNSIEKSYVIEEQMKNCILCFKSIKESEFIAHVNNCLPKEKTTEPIKQQTLTCFSCRRSIDIKKDLYRKIPCPSYHIYCLLCLQHSMVDFVETHLTPLCHSTFCNYQLSQFDIAVIPLERRISDQLLKLAKGQQRPQCPKCHFYVNINNYNDYYEHVDTCGELIPCEYCSCPYLIDQLHNHIRQCRNDQTPRNDKLLNFIVTKTKYPFPKEKIQLFIQQTTKKKSANVNPLSIVESLANFGQTFPIDIPTKDCDVCMEACPYEDIYVFDCPDSHKLCYACYYRSCETKMANNEVLTCGLCSTPLNDVELNQLRISDEEKEKFRNYQIKKVLDVYSNHTRGIIKCPNQNCTWIAEAEDPTECFKVTCPLCQREFCSLCNEKYHYRTKCQELPQITQQWFLWCQTERTRYLTNRAQEDAVYAARLDEYNQQMSENEARNRDLRRRYDELMADENYKVQHCRLCPSCHRVVQRLEGCDKMICGQDAHGGNVQSGCGTKFNWKQAQPYVATTTIQPEQMIIDLPKPENPIVHHIGVKCDECQNDVIGIRFDCVYCPSLIYCEKCEQQATLKHAKFNEKKKEQSHVFKLIMKS